MKGLEGLVKDAKAPSEEAKPAAPSKPGKAKAAAAAELAEMLGVDDAKAFTRALDAYMKACGMGGE